MGSYAHKLDIELFEFHSHTKNLQMYIECKAADRGWPWTCVYVLPRVMKEIKVWEKGILNYVIPLESGFRRPECSGSYIVAI